MKKNIAILAGGYTGEYVISMQTADTIMRNIDRERYNVFKIIITGKEWYAEAKVKGEAEGERRLPVDKNDFSIPARAEGEGGRDGGQSREGGPSGADRAGEESEKGSERILFDAALIAIHGTPGEDGKLQGYLDMLGIPYTGCNAATSAITMNKSYTKQVVAGLEGLRTARSVQLFRERPSDTAEQLGNLRLPLFVKPNNGGSSIGMSKVTRPEDLEEALEKAFREDRQVLVEEFVGGKEFSVGAFRSKGLVEVLPATEIVSSREFFDFEAKYTPGVSEEITPGRLSEKERTLLEEAVIKVYRRLDCRGVVRMDFILAEGSPAAWYLIEVNTVPGQAENSILPRQVRAKGWSMKEFYSLLLEEALSGK